MQLVRNCSFCLTRRITQVTQNDFPNMFRRRFFPILTKKILLFDVSSDVQSRAIHFGRQGHSLTQSKMLHCKIS
jgi:hypothetical protein